MRCYYMRGGHFVDVDEVSGLSDEEAIAKAHALFSEREDLFEGFELWDRTRVGGVFSLMSWRSWRCFSLR
jgi:hypothetical protein